MECALFGPREERNPAEATESIEKRWIGLIFFRPWRDLILILGGCPGINAWAIFGSMDDAQAFMPGLFSVTDRADCHFSIRPARVWFWRVGDSVGETPTDAVETTALPGKSLMIGAHLSVGGIVARAERRDPRHPDGSGRALPISGHLSL
jgi:hypothetical protein